MSEALTLARPYARAAFELASSAKALADWSGKLGFAAQVAADPRVHSLNGDPRIAASDLTSLFLPAETSVDSAFGNYIRLLAENGRLSLLPEITAIFEVLKHDAERILKVSVRSATAIDPAQVASLKAALSKRFNREIELEQKLDATVIGGAIIDAGDVVIDGSVAGRLQRLSSALAH
jgi:F-type H+-transporting ATPase subunit delta